MAGRIVLFICVENACRSLMAEAMFNARRPRGWGAISAGMEPASHPNPRTGPMLQEIGLSLPSHPPQILTVEMMTRASVRVTMGCLGRESCPARLKTLPLVDWALQDPGKLDNAGFRQVRDELQRRVDQLIQDLANPAHSGELL